MAKPMKKSMRKKTRKAVRKSTRKASQKRILRKNKTRTQRGGMSPWATTGDEMLLHNEARGHAEMTKLDSHISDLSSVIPKGGARRTRSRQRGGMSSIHSPGLLLASKAYVNAAGTGTNPQFFTEKNVNTRFHGF